MSLASPPSCACPTPVTTNVPGPPGAGGLNGINAFSITQVDATCPSVNSTVSLVVNTNQWMVVGQNVYVGNTGIFSVTSLAGTTVATLTYLNYVGNTNAGNDIPVGTQVSPAGTQPAITNPLPIANGGTNAITQAAAQVSLGLGQNASFVNVNGLTQSVTATPTLIAGVTFSVPAGGTGLYLVLAFATVDIAGATWGSSEAVTLTVEDTTATAVVAQAIKNTQTPTTLQLPSLDWITPPLTATLTAAHVLQLQISIAVTPSAGTIKVSSAGLLILPLAL